MKAKFIRMRGTRVIARTEAEAISKRAKQARLRRKGLKSKSINLGAFGI